MKFINRLFQFRSPIRFLNIIFFNSISLLLIFFGIAASNLNQYNWRISKDFFNDQIKLSKLNSIEGDLTKESLDNISESNINCNRETQTDKVSYLFIYDQTRSVQMSSINYVLLQDTISKHISSKFENKQVNNLLTKYDLSTLMTTYFNFKIEQERSTNETALAITNYYGFGKVNSPYSGLSSNRWWIKDFDSFYWDIDFTFDQYKKIPEDSLRKQWTNYAILIQEIKDKYIKSNPFKDKPNNRIVVTIFSDFYHESENRNQNNQFESFSNINYELQELKKLDVNNIYQFNLVQFPVDTNYINKNTSISEVNKSIKKLLSLFKTNFYNTYYYQFLSDDFNKKNIIDYLDLIISPVIQKGEMPEILNMYYSFNLLKSSNTAIGKINFKNFSTNQYQIFLETNAYEDSDNFILSFSIDDPPKIENSINISYNNGYKNIYDIDRYIVTYAYNSRTLRNTPDYCLVVKPKNKLFQLRYEIDFKQRLSVVIACIIMIFIYIIITSLFLYAFLITLYAFFLYNLKRNINRTRGAPVMIALLFLILINLTTLILFGVDQYKISVWFVSVYIFQIFSLIIIIITFYRQIDHSNIYGRFIRIHHNEI